MRKLNAHRPQDPYAILRAAHSVGQSSRSRSRFACRHSIAVPDPLLPIHRMVQLITADDLRTVTRGLIDDVILTRKLWTVNSLSRRDIVPYESESECKRNFPATAPGLGLPIAYKSPFIWYMRLSFSPGAPPRAIPINVMTYLPLLCATLALTSAQVRIAKQVGSRKVSKLIPRFAS